jgi:hypothetical protein
MRVHVGADVKHEQHRGRDRGSRQRRGPAVESGAGPDANQEVNEGDSQRIEEARVDVVCLGGDDASHLGDDGGAVTDGRRIHIIEPRAAIPKRLPAGVREIFGEIVAIGDERRVDGHPVVVILGLENRPDHGRRNSGDQEHIQGPGFAFGQKADSLRMSGTALFYNPG